MTAAVLAEARARVAAGLSSVAGRLEAAGMPSPDWNGKLIRPLVGYAAAGSRAPSNRGPAPEMDGLWAALAAVQLAHEASLLHDDVLDGAASRRGGPTLAASRGVAAALVEGDHLLTAAYRVASWTGSAAWMGLFARAVERTVAGEKAQAASRGRPLSLTEYGAIVVGKSGELLGAAMAAAAVLRGETETERWTGAGRRLGVVYQMLDDLLDYCPHVDTGKPALGDYAAGLWTWPLEELRLEPGLSGDEVARRIRAPGPDGRLPLRRCADRLRAVAESTRQDVALLLPDDLVVPALLDEWVSAAESAASALELPSVAGWRGSMAEHARSFRFASRLFPAERRDQVLGVYAWCRYTDDLVDRSDDPADVRERRLDAWLAISRRAYEGDRTGNELADTVMAAMREARVPFAYAAELVEGVRMDLRDTTYDTLAELDRYTYRVAGVVGLWVTELFGIRDPWILERAESLGRAMQLTNIARDVGEDLRSGRLYLPASWLRSRGLDRAALMAMMDSGRMTPEYRDMVETLLRAAEREYDHALPAIRRLPAFYRRPVAVAADVYRGIHHEIRRNGYDNLRHRAHTSLATKLRLGAHALRSARPHAGGAAPARLARFLGITAALALAAPAGARAQQTEAPAVRVVSGADLLHAAPAGAIETPTRDQRTLEALGRLWILGVEDRAAVEAGLESVARLRRDIPAEAAETERLLRAYEGAFLALRAKHGGWPPDRLRNLRRGFELLDGAVAEAPDGAELRYIRLMSGFYLPGLFGRGDEVEQDLSALAFLLPAASDRFPPALLPQVVAFVLEHGAPAPELRRRLEALLP